MPRSNWDKPEGVTTKGPDSEKRERIMRRALSHGILNSKAAKNVSPKIQRNAKLLGFTRCGHFDILSQ